MALGPGARVAVDNQGNVYGMTPTGGANGLGTIYALHRQVEWRLGAASHPHFHRQDPTDHQARPASYLYRGGHIIRRGDHRRGEW